MTWTRFMDMHSGGGQKLDWPFIAIEAPIDEAKVIFYNRFHRNPERVTCTCCGEDYSIGEHETLAMATAYDRGLRYIEDVRGWLYGKNRPADYREPRYLEPGEPVPEGYHEKYRGDGEGKTLEAYLAEGNYLVIHHEEIKPEERVGALPAEGFIWAGGDDE